MDYKINKRIKDKVDAFIKGFHEVISPIWL